MQKLIFFLWRNLWGISFSDSQWTKSYLKLPKQHNLTFPSVNQLRPNFTFLSISLIPISLIYTFECCNFHALSKSDKIRFEWEVKMQFLISLDSEVWNVLNLWQLPILDMDCLEHKHIKYMLFIMTKDYKWKKIVNMLAMPFCQWLAACT